MRNHDRDERAVIPIAPEERIPVMASPIPIAAGTRTGLKMMNTGVATARPISEPTNVRPERSRRVPPTGRRDTTARILEADGPCCSPRSAMVGLYVNGVKWVLVRGSDGVLLRGREI